MPININRVAQEPVAPVGNHPKNKPLNMAKDPMVLSIPKTFDYNPETGENEERGTLTA